MTDGSDGRNTNSTLTCEVLVVGGGLGGVAAALSASRLGRTVILTEECDRLGGQLTSQAVPMDEHPWMDRFGSTSTYRRLRAKVRDYYKRNYPVTALARAQDDFTPGAALTTHLSCEPRVAGACLDEMLAPFRANGTLRTYLNLRPVCVHRDGRVIRSVEFEDCLDGRAVAVEASYILDATETGDLLVLGELDYVTGMESARETGEPHALPGDPEPQNMQAFTVCFALAYRPGEDHSIEKPADYDFWRDYQADFESGRHFSLNPRPTRAHQYELFPSGDPGKFSLWQYRRILYTGAFAPGYLTGDVSLINSSHNDYWLGSIVDVPEDEARKHVDRARGLSLSFLYWLQNEIPRHEGGYGYPELGLLPEYTGTKDGLAKRPYIREGRRIRALFTVTENHVGLEARPDDKVAEPFADSVGIGCYNIDLHPTTGGRPSINLKTRPFCLPLGALIPHDADNFLAAAKNIGVTHITNGCFRLHSTEWNVGEVAGALAAQSVDLDKRPAAIRENPQLLANFQRLLDRLGVEREWPDLSVGTSYYSAARMVPDWDWGEYNKQRPMGGRFFI